MDHLRSFLDYGIEAALTVLSPPGLFTLSRDETLVLASVSVLILLFSTIAAASRAVAPFGIAAPVIGVCVAVLAIRQFDANDIARIATGYCVLVRLIDGILAGASVRRLLSKARRGTRVPVVVPPIAIAAYSVLANVFLFCQAYGLAKRALGKNLRTTGVCAGFALVCLSGSLFVPDFGSHVDGVLYWTVFPAGLFLGIFLAPRAAPV